MKNYMKKYIPLLLACFLAGCFTSKAAPEKDTENITLNVGEVFTFGTDTEPSEIIVAGGDAKILDVIEFKLGKHAQFEFNSVDLTAEGKENLGDIAEELRKYPGAVFTIVGHTDTTGNVSYNNALSERRAETISQTLQNRYGITNRIEILGKGPSEPKASNDTLAGRQANRRAEIYVTNQN